MKYKPKNKQELFKLIENKKICLGITTALINL